MTSSQCSLTQRILFVFASFGAVEYYYARAFPCIPNAVPSDRRIDVVNGGPVKMLRYSWESSGITGYVAKIILEEYLGYRTVVTGRFGGSWRGPRALAGWIGSDGSDGICEPGKNEDYSSCDVDNVTGHYIFDAWAGGEKEYYQMPADIQPHMFPMGHTGFEGTFLPSEGIQHGYQEHPPRFLMFYKSLNASVVNLSKYFSPWTATEKAIQEYSFEKAKCRREEIPQAYAGCSFYEKYTGDMEMFTWQNGSCNLNCDNDWILSPACRAAPSTCVAWVTTGDGWGVEEIMQQAALWNFALAIVVLPDWSAYTTLPKLLPSLYFWFFPDTAFYSSQPPVRLMEPWTDENERRDRLYRTGAAAINLRKFIWNKLEGLSPVANMFLRSVSFSNGDERYMMDLLLVPNTTEEDVACQWITSNEASWMAWIPLATQCGRGMGLATNVGEGLLKFVDNRSDAVKCEDCEPGRFSYPLLDKNGLTYTCRPCDVGKFTDARLASMCEECGIGKVAELQGQSKCFECYKGKYASSTQESNLSAIARCLPCQSGRYSSESGSRNCEACPLGRYSAQSGLASCEVCPVGTFSDRVGRTSCLSCGTQLLGSTSPRASQSLEDCTCPKDMYRSIEDGKCVQCGFLQVTAKAGATLRNACYFGLEFYLLVFAPVVSLILLVFAFLTKRFYRKTIRRIHEAQLSAKIVDCIETSRDLSFPMMIMSAKHFKSLGRLIPFEEALDKQLLRMLSTVQQVENFRRDKHIIFFSHQWLAYDQPDPKCVHYNAISSAIDSVLLQNCWTQLNSFVWVDYHSIPQASKKQQNMAIRSLPFFASLASLFIIVAPDTEHGHTGLSCNLDTYGQRMWCRCEIFSFSCKRGCVDLWKLDETGKTVIPVEETDIRDTMLVFQGDCACCARNHRGRNTCDKELLRDIFIGLYADALWLHQASKNKLSRDSLMDRARSMIDPRGFVMAIQSQKELLFPRWLETKFEFEDRNMLEDMMVMASVSSSGESQRSKSERPSARKPSPKRTTTIRNVKKELFGDLISTLEAMMEDNYEVIQHLFETNTTEEALTRPVTPTSYSTMRVDLEAATTGALIKLARSMNIDDDELVAVEVKEDLIELIMATENRPRHRRGSMIVHL